MQFPITVGLRRSRFLGRGLLCLHGLAALVVVLTPWPWWERLLVGLLALGLGAWAFRRLAPVASSLRLYPDGQLALDEADTRYGVLPGAYVHPVLTVFWVVDGVGKPCAIVVLPDSCSAEEARRLRVWLRWKVSVPAAGDA